MADQYVLLTQCLQNDFFFNEECKLCLPKDAAARLLFNADDDAQFETKNGRRVLPDESRERSPLLQFLKTVVGGRVDGTETSRLHLINVRDWHVPGPHYDRERRLYGAHCEGGTSGADYLNGFTEFLDPARGGTFRPSPKSKSKTVPRWDERLAVHHVYSDTLFDFQERDDEGAGIRKDSPLAIILDDIVRRARGATLHVALIGVLTDIKVQLNLVGLRSRYDFRELAVSDALTASRSLDRHHAALDYASNVLWVDVIDTIPELAHFMGVRQEVRPIWGRGATREESYDEYLNRKNQDESRSPEPAPKGDSTPGDGPRRLSTVATLLVAIGTFIGGVAAAVGILLR